MLANVSKKRTMTSDILQRLIIASGGRQADLARRLGVCRAAVHDYVRRGYLPLKHAKAAKLIDPSIKIEDIHREYHRYAARRVA